MPFSHTDLLLVTKIVVLMGTDSDVRPHNNFSISDNQTSSHQCSLAMLICSCIPLVCLNPSSVNLDRAVGLCGRCYHSLNHCDCYPQRTTDSMSAALHFSPCGLGIVYAFTLTTYPFKIRKAYTHFCIYCRRLWYA